MSRQMPSMVALLGLLAVAGYKNRDKISEILGTTKQSSGNSPGQQDQKGTQGGVLGNLGGLLGGASTGSVLSGGLRDLIDRFRQSGHGQAADWDLHQTTACSCCPMRDIVHRSEEALVLSAMC